MLVLDILQNVQSIQLLLSPQRVWLASFKNTTHTHTQPPVNN